MLHKTTLIDFPGRVAAMLFTLGCNFHCPYCHNPGLVRGQPPSDALDAADVLDFLRSRKKLLQGVVISGGEPCLHEDLPELCAALRDLGYAIKLDTNGSCPDMLERLLAGGLVDYVAMDVKSDPAAYPASLCPAPAAAGLARSLALLGASGVEHEFRLTCVYPFVDEAIFSRILESLPRDVTLYLQAARLNRLDDVLDPPFFETRGRALDSGEIEALRGRALAIGQACEIR